MSIRDCTSSVISTLFGLTINKQLMKIKNKTYFQVIKYESTNEEFSQRYFALSIFKKKSSSYEKKNLQ